MAHRSMTSELQKAERAFRRDLASMALDAAYAKREATLRRIAARFGVEVQICGSCGLVNIGMCGCGR